MSAKDIYGTSPLHPASLNENEKIVSLLLETGADVVYVNVVRHDFFIYDAWRVPILAIAICSCLI
jgi:ankyrin repeat protein